MSTISESRHQPQAVCNSKPVVDTLLLERLQRTKLALKRVGIDMEVPPKASQQHNWNEPVSMEALLALGRED